MKFPSFTNLNTPSHTQSTDIPSSDSNHDAPQSTLSETVAATPSTKQATSPFAPKCAYPSAFLLHPARLRSKCLPNGRYDSGNVPQPFQATVPDESAALILSPVPFARFASIPIFASPFKVKFPRFTLSAALPFTRSNFAPFEKLVFCALKY